MKMTVLKTSALVAACLSTFLSQPLLASDFTLDGFLQPQFETLSKDLTAALSYKSIAPAEPLGLTGFDVGVQVSATRIKSAEIWNDATGDNIDYLPMARLSVQKGLPFGIDVGVTYTAIPTTDVSLWGAEVKYAILEGGVATPAVAIRGSYSKLNGVEELDFESKGVDLSISKGLVNLTPYAGIGHVWSDSTPHADPVLGLRAVSQSEMKYFAGVNINVLIGDIAIEWDRTGDNDTLSTRLGFRF